MLNLINDKTTVDMQFVLKTFESIANEMRFQLDQNEIIYKK